MLSSLVLFLTLTLPGQADSESVATEQHAPESSTKQRQAEVAEMAKLVIREQQFVVGEERKELAACSEAILRWSNPTAGEVYGDVFVWTDHGRPAMVASIYRWFRPNWGATLEVCSLSPSKLMGRRDAREFWTPNEAGLRWRPIDEADPPAKTPAARLSQMKRLAAEFTTALSDTRGTDRAVGRQLRQLAQPIFRYPTPTADATYSDGALFAFVEGTDPEVLLLVEATRDADGSRWQYGLARMNRDELRVSFRGQPVWSTRYLTTAELMSRPREPYTLFLLDAETGRVKP